VTLSVPKQALTIPLGFVQEQCLLEGDKTGPVLSVSPLLPEEGLQVMNGLNSSSQGRSSHPPTLGSVMGGMGSVVGGMVGSVGGMDVGRKFLYDGATPSDEGPRPMFVLVTHHTVLVVTFFFFLGRLFKFKPRENLLNKGFACYILMSSY
jgi:hypothetical protein